MVSTTISIASLPVQAYKTISEQRGISRHSNGSNSEAARMECAIYAFLGAQLPGMLPVRLLSTCCCGCTALTGVVRKKKQLDTFSFDEAVPTGRRRMALATHRTI